MRISTYKTTIAIRKLATAYHVKITYQETLRDDPITRNYAVSVYSVGRLANLILQSSDNWQVHKGNGALCAVRYEGN